MAVVIRLLGLRITAGSEDIRKFFSGLKIPDGGVHIIGGEQDEAFIIFASDEDARRAMTRSGGCIKGSPVNLLLSSKSEMQSILESSTKNTVHNKQQQHEEFRRREKEGTDPSFNQNLAMEKRRPRHLEMGNRFVQDQYGEARLLNRKPESNGVDDLYLMLKGMPFSVIEDEVRKLFQGLAVDDVILMKNHRGQNNGKGFVKFRTRQDAREGIKRDREYIGSRFVEVYPATEREWMEAGGAMAGNVDGFNQTFRKGSLPPYRRRYPQERARSRSPLNYKSAPSSDEEFCVFLENLPYSVQKREVRELFRHASLKEDQILYLLDSEGKRTRSMFVLFRSLTDYCAALTHHKKDFLNRCLYISPISKEKMISFLEMNEHTTDDLPERHSMSQERQPLSFSDPYDSEKGRFHLNNLVSYKSASPSDEEFCVLLENLSYSVQKRDVKDLFRHASLNEDQILYLLDSEGKQTRSLFVLFRTLTDYCAALTHHKKDFLNRCLYISPISKEKMISILETNKHTTGKLSEKHSISQESQPLSHSDPYDSEKVCLYVRNLPFDVRKVEIMDFFLGFSISEDSVILLRDNRGSGLGEALVIFQTEREAMTAQSLNGQRFLGSELILKCISRFQMCKFGVAEHAVEAQRERVIGSEKYDSRNSDAPLHSHDMECFDYLTPDGYAPPTDLQVHIHGGSSLYSNNLSPHGPQDSGNGSLHGGFGPPAQHSDNPTCLKLVNLPLQITIDEIYDFCYGYRVIPGSVSLQYNRNGVPKGSATVVFESRQEALTAVEELSGRPIGTRKIQLLFV